MVDKAPIAVNDPDGLVDKQKLDEEAKAWEKNQGSLNPSECLHILRT